MKYLKVNAEPDSGMRLDMTLEEFGQAESLYLDHIRYFTGTSEGAWSCLEDALDASDIPKVRHARVRDNISRLEDVFSEYGSSYCVEVCEQEMPPEPPWEGTNGAWGRKMFKQIHEAVDFNLPDNYDKAEWPLFDAIFAAYTEEIGVSRLQVIDNAIEALHNAAMGKFMWKRCRRTEDRHALSKVVFEVLSELHRKRNLV